MTQEQAGHVSDVRELVWFPDTSALVTLAVHSPLQRAVVATLSSHRREQTGKGNRHGPIATAIDYAHQSVAATDIYAGVSHGNTAGERALERTGFARVSAFDNSRFHGALTK